MFDISELKAKKLPELQGLAKELGVPKFRSLKKLDLVYRILDYQEKKPSDDRNQSPKEDTKPKQSGNPSKGPSKERHQRPQRNDNRNNKNQGQKNLEKVGFILFVKL